MSTFEKLKVLFKVNWMTVLVGWNGLGGLSPWPARWIEFPPLISADEIAAYASEMLTSSSNLVEQNLLIALLSFDIRNESREAVKNLLTPLSVLSNSDQSLELRKWRLVLLEETLASMPKDAVYGLMALSEFWQSFGFPTDCPHEVQGRGNTIGPFEYYQQENLDRLVALHCAWIEEEKAVLQCAA